MPIYYLEIIEELTEEEMLIREPLMIRVEVKDKNEAIQKAQELESLFTGKKYRKQFHIHYHQENMPCEIEEL